MRRIGLGCAVALLLAGGSQMAGQRGGNPFIDHSDTGERLHILPAPAAVRSPHDPQPTCADLGGETKVFSASYGPGNLVDHGGPQISGAGFKAIYWNANVANSTATSTQTTAHYNDLASEIDAFVNSFPATKNWSNS